MMALRPYAFRTSLLDDFFNGVLVDSNCADRKVSNAKPAVDTLALDVKEDETKYELAFNVPGISKEKIDLNVDDNVLTLSVETVSEKNEKDEGSKYIYQERSFGKVSRSLRLPENVNLDDIKAKQDNGVLYVTVPKLPEQNKTKKIEVTSNL
mmetsp:Transcript_41802/g.58167  ORF Transcript_41802/g.58167 Transcript_41802/m.58167 type:complete len:152 (-) Transcript_41802:199-654(-)